MRKKYGQLLGFLALFGLVMPLPAHSQLPPTNMGKFVHQPGDNQYSQQTQAERHGSPAPSFQMGGGGQGMMMVPLTPAPPAPDPSLDPIACDEPIPVAGFPPLPDRLDLPTDAGAWTNKSSTGGGGSGITFHEHYAHIPLSAISKPRGNSDSGQDQDGGSGDSNGSGDGGGGNSGTGSGYRVNTVPLPSGGSGYYKAGTVALPSQSQNGGGYYKAGTVALPSQGQNGGGYYKARTPNSDTFNANSQAGSPQYGGTGANDLKALGNEPKLSNDSTQAPSQAQAVQVNQSTTQDLSLPEDQTSYQYKQTSGTSKFGKGVGKALSKPLHMMGGMSGMSGMHF